MVYELTKIDLDHYYFKDPLLALFTAMRARGHKEDDISITIDVTQPTGGSYALRYTDKGETHHAK